MVLFDILRATTVGSVVEERGSRNLRQACSKINFLLINRQKKNTGTSLFNSI